MVVRHNLTAMNANRMLGMTQSSQAKSSEKLSSGYRINRAADDAAGLSISEKMRKQIKGLDKASSNAQDGVSAVQTAEGALTEVHSMLQRMNELAVQASNGTNSEDDRAAIQAEIEQLTTEIDRVAETTKFNETYLLKGTDAKTTKTVDAYDAGLAGTLGKSENGKTTFTADKLEVGSSVTIAGKEYNIVESSKTSDYTSIKEYTAAAGDVLVQDGKKYTYVNASGTTPAGATAAAAGWFAEDNTSTTKDSVTLEAGSTLTTKTDGKTTTLVGSTGYDMDTVAVAAPTVGDGDTVTRDGKVYTYSATKSKWLDEEGTAQATFTVKAGDVYFDKSADKELQIDNKGISTVENIQDYIKTLADGKKVTIYSDINDTTGKQYTIGVSTKDDGTAYTADDIAALVKEGNYVTDDANSKYYYAVPKSSDSESDISLKQAYNMMAEELAKASSIGADKKATVENNGDGTFTINQGSVEVNGALNFNLHVGADADMTNKIAIGIESMGSASLGIKGITVADDTGVNATYAIDAITNALSKVSSQRSALGAVQNRLEHTIDNLDNVVENTTAAESRIRDTDMAKEMVEFSKTNILAQAGQSILAQANQSTQGILSLLG